MAFCSLGFALFFRTDLHSEQILSIIKVQAKLTCFKVVGSFENFKQTIIFFPEECALGA